LFSSSRTSNNQTDTVFVTVKKGRFLHIALVGMSNIGKSHWARRLEKQARYERVECDAMIERKLGVELTRLGYAGIADVAKWMGQPYEPRYPETSAKYLAYETEVMREVLARLKTDPEKPMVIDTTGSVIHTGSAILDELKARTRVIYFEASLNHVSQLFERYMANPKPVIWEKPMQVADGEDPRDALRKGYPKLLADRARRYAELAHMTLPYERHKSFDADLSLIFGSESARP